MGGEMSIPSPVYDNENIYLGNAGGRETKGVLYAVKAGAEGDITPADSGLVSEGVNWTFRDAGTSNPSPLLFNGQLYLLNGRGGELQCIDAATGKQIYKEKIEKVGACWASPWVYNNKIYFYDEKGVAQIIQAGKEFKVLSQNSLKDKFWSSVAITDDAYIFKGVEKLFCVGK
jgi:outer membrane protein assembly factor BamB